MVKVPLSMWLVDRNHDSGTEMSRPTRCAPKKMEVQNAPASSLAPTRLDRATTDVSQSPGTRSAEPRQT
eukprot:scaffold16844_cov32-Tisochrysis_lutea.AAC.4